MDVTLIAGIVSTALFAVANLPMVIKAVRTRELGSYSLPALATTNAGNLVHTVYVVSLPVGPVWVLHGFYLGSMAVMLVLYLRYMLRRTPDPIDAARSAGASMKDA